MSVSCVADPDFASGAEMATLLEAYQAQTAGAEEAREAREQAALKLIRIDPGEAGEPPMLSVDLDQADLNRVLAAIMQSPLVDYRTQPRYFSQRVSARFSNRPLIEGLNLLLKEANASVSWEDGLLSLQMKQLGVLLDANEGNDESSVISREYVLKHVAAIDMVDLIDSLFDTSDFSDEGGVTIGSLPELNTIFLSGTAAEVSEALAVVRQADRPAAHVIIEALVVKIDTSSVESLTVNLTDGASGKFDLTTLIPGQTGGNIVASFSDLAANSAAITATVDFLAAQNAAEILARPYVATRSSKEATIAIVDDQFARVDTSGDDSSIIATDSITAGITMDITPLVMADQSIRMDVSLEDSRFSATAGDIIIAKQRSTASTSMVVQSGQTIVIGGLNSRYRLTDHSGLPWLRHVPILNLFASDQAAVESREELVVYVTPYLWTPGLETPLPLPGRPEPELPDYLSVETGGTPVK